MNYDVALKEVDTILKELGERISHTRPEVEYELPKLRKEIAALVSSIFSNERDRGWYGKWYDEYHETLKKYCYGPYDSQIFHWAEYLKALKRDVERRTRFEQPATTNTIIEPLSFRLPFYILLLVLVSSWVWLVPVLLNFSNGIWQMVAQVAVVLIWLGVYSKFSFRNIKKEAIISGITQTVIGLLVTYLSFKFGWL